MITLSRFSLTTGCFTVAILFLSGGCGSGGGISPGCATAQDCVQVQKITGVATPSTDRCTYFSNPCSSQTVTDRFAYWHIRNRHLTKPLLVVLQPEINFDNTGWKNEPNTQPFAKRIEPNNSKTLGCLFSRYSCLHDDRILAEERRYRIISSCFEDEDCENPVKDSGPKKDSNKSCLMSCIDGDSSCIDITTEIPPQVRNDIESGVAALINEPLPGYFHLDDVLAVGGCNRRGTALIYDLGLPANWSGDPCDLGFSFPDADFPSPTERARYSNLWVRLPALITFKLDRSGRDMGLTFDHEHERPRATTKLMYQDGSTEYTTDDLQSLQYDDEYAWLVFEGRRFVCVGIRMSLGWSTEN